MQGMTDEQMSRIRNQLKRDVAQAATGQPSVSERESIEARYDLLLEIERLRGALGMMGVEVYMLKSTQPRAPFWTPALRDSMPPYDVPVLAYGDCHENGEYGFKLALCANDCGSPRWVYQTPFLDYEESRIRPFKPLYWTHLPKPPKETTG